MHHEYQLQTTHNQDQLELHKHQHKLTKALNIGHRRGNEQLAIVAD